MNTSGQKTSCVIRVINLTAIVIKLQTAQEIEGAMREVDVELGLQIIAIDYHMGRVELLLESLLSHYSRLKSQNVRQP